MHNKIFDIIFHQDEVTWQSILMDLVKSEEMDPWDIDVSMLTHKYIERLKNLKSGKGDLRIPGKVLLAAAILLRIKSHRLLTEDIASFDNMISGEDEESLYEENEEAPQGIDRSLYKDLKLIPKTPQPRKRKVSIYDLLEALQKALDVEQKRRIRIPKEVKIELPEKKIDISELMGKIYVEVLTWYKKGKGEKENKKIPFHKLVPNGSREGKIYTFIPLLHLTNQRKIDMEQKTPFGTINIKVIKDNIDKEIEKEIPVEVN
jgi:segregation and condensation protein A